MSSENENRIGLACAGGGIEGAVYEIGALCALEESIEGLDLNGLHVYVGVSAGAFVTSCLANGISSHQMSRAILSKKTDVHPIKPGTFFTPAYSEYLSKTGKAPGTFAAMLLNYFFHRDGEGMGSSISKMAELLPVGIFDNTPLKKYLETNFNLIGGTDDFKELKTKLRIVATDLDSSKSVVFGGDGWDHIPISLAVQASTALPAVYVPVKIGERYYIDGVAQRTVHASVALQEGAGLVFCINPIVPYEAVVENSNGNDALSEILVDRGLPAVLSQTFRTMIHSRMNIGINRYKQEFPDRDLIIFEPLPTDYRMFFTNIFSFSSRMEICEYAYQSTRKSLRDRLSTIEPILQKNGLRIRHDVLSISNRTLYDLDRDMNGYLAARRLGDTLRNLDTLLDRIGA